MSTIDIDSVSANCGKCGSTEMKYEENFSDDSEVRCANCDAFIGNIAGIRAAMVATAKSAMPQIAADLKKALKLK